jgi:RNA polymerase sigma-70 factor (ECF subfamily)
MDVKDYNACVNLWADALFRFACKCTGHEEDARDVVQNSFEVLWQKRLDVAPGKGKAFLFQVAYRQAIDNYRKKSRVSYKEELPETGASYTPSHPDLKRVLERALAQLDERSRALVLLKDHEGYSYEEIGRITELSDSQVKVYLHRARKVLKDYLVRVENVI